MLWFFEPLWACGMLGVGFIMSFFIRVGRRTAIVMDIVSLGLGKMAIKSYREGILLFIFAPLLAFIFKYFLQLTDQGQIVYWIAGIVYLWFCIKVAILSDRPHK